MSPTNTVEKTFSPEEIVAYTSRCALQTMRTAGVLNEGTSENWDYTAIK